MMTKLNFSKLLDDLYRHQVNPTTTRLVPREDNQYDLQIAGLTVMTLHATALRRLPEKYLSELIRDGVDEGFTLALMIAVKNNQGVILYPDGFNPELSEEDG